jgi:hypothetical protein
MEREDVDKDRRVILKMVLADVGGGRCDLVQMTTNWD